MGDKGIFFSSEMVTPGWKLPCLVRTSFTHVNDPSCEFLLNHHFDINRLANNDSKPAW